MGGDDSQKLLPWRGSYSSPGRKPPAQQINTLPAAGAVVSSGSDPSSRGSDPQIQGRQ
jgi:hypothetical protein